MLKTLIGKAVVTNFSSDTLTVTFKSTLTADRFKRSQAKFEETAAQSAKRPIKISVIVDESLLPPVVNKMAEPARSNLATAMDFFHATNATKIND